MHLNIIPYTYPELVLQNLEKEVKNETLHLKFSYIKVSYSALYLSRKYKRY